MDLEMCDLAARSLAVRPRWSLNRLIAKPMHPAKVTGAVRRRLSGIADSGGPKVDADGKGEARWVASSLGAFAKLRTSFIGASFGALGSGIAFYATTDVGRAAAL